MLASQSVVGDQMDTKDVKVAALMTAPRYECVAARNTIEFAMHSAGVPLTISQGVFYHQCMQSMMESIVGNVDYIITVDFDSIFTAKHVQRLLSIVAQENKIDALAAIQPMRGKKRMLGSRYEGGEVGWDGYPVKVDSAHFGLTVIDARKLADLPKPWFHNQPDERGSWGEDRIDADVWFWRQWEKAGNSVYIDPGCRLGHLEELVSVYDREMRLHRMYLGEWKENAEAMVDG